MTSSDTNDTTSADSMSSCCARRGRHHLRARRVVVGSREMPAPEMPSASPRGLERAGPFMAPSAGDALMDRRAAVNRPCTGEVAWKSICPSRGTCASRAALPEARQGLLVAQSTCNADHHEVSVEPRTRCANGSRRAWPVAGRSRRLPQENVLTFGPSGVLVLSARRRTAAEVLVPVRPPSSRRGSQARPRAHYLDHSLERVSRSMQ